MFEIEIGKDIVWLDEVNSTNSYASKLLGQGAPDGMVIAARHQTEGKGQRGNSWESAKDKNLTFSIILYPNFLEVQKQFLISKVASLAVYDTLTPMLKNISIKWPNDIYINNSKVAGILIENSFSSKMMGSCIIGIGINVNQNTFHEDLPNPTSLINELGKPIDLILLLNNFIKSINSRYQQLRDKDFNRISSDYFQALYHKNDYYSYRAKGEKFTARVVDIRESGELVLETTSGEILEFGFKEVSFGE
jgi:BirA family biotin operon repressor/biotin-[acetyl-CoA-carboxylase] ligase